MNSKQVTNLEVSKKSELNVEVFPFEKYSVFTNTFKIPFKELEVPIENNLSVFKVISTFSDVIIEALEARMESCMNMLSRNLFNVVESNEFHVLFKKEDGSLHSFSHLAFSDMQKAIRLIKENKPASLKQRQYDQIVKALYWVEKPAPRNGISFGNLISVCIGGVYTSRS